MNKVLSDILTVKEINELTNFVENNHVIKIERCDFGTSVSGLKKGIKSKPISNWIIKRKNDDTDRVTHYRYTLLNIDNNNAYDINIRGLMRYSLGDNEKQRLMTEVIIRSPKSSKKSK